MLQIFFAYFLSIPVLIAFDLGWLGFVMRSFYQTRLAGLLAPTPNWFAAGVFYPFFVAGLFYFAAYPAYTKHSILSAVVAGALFGLFAYGTYDLTNMATLQNWPLAVTVVDMLWGTFLGGVLGAVGYGLLTLFI